MTQHIAHVRQDKKGDWQFHRLPDHLRNTAERAAAFARPFASEDWIRPAGLWHDLGKYRPDFQRYIRNASGCDPEAHIEGMSGRVDHSTAGAIHACRRLGPGPGINLGTPRHRRRQTGHLNMVT